MARLLDGFLVHQFTVTLLVANEFYDQTRGVVTDCPEAFLPARVEGNLKCVERMNSFLACHIGLKRPPHNTLCDMRKHAFFHQGMQQTCCTIKLIELSGSFRCRVNCRANFSLNPAFSSLLWGARSVQAHANHPDRGKEAFYAQAHSYDVDVERSPNVRLRQCDSEPSTSMRIS